MRQRIKELKAKIAELKNILVGEVGVMETKIQEELDNLEFELISLNVRLRILDTLASLVLPSV